MSSTLTEVARAAGVSLATASRAFSDPGRLSAPTLRKVLDAAAELGFETPNAAARGSHTVAVVVPDIANAVMARLVASIGERAWQGRHRILLADTHEDSAREREVLETVGRTVDGIILCSPRLAAEAVPDAAGVTPLVVINGEAHSAPAVLMDVDEGLGQAVDQLYAFGHRRMVYVPGPAASWANRRRAECLARLAVEHDMDLVSVRNQNASVDGGLAAAASVAASGATAVVAFNDLVALGVRAGAHGLGYRCPEDLSIVGVDDTDVGAAAEPGLTSVRVGIARSGALGLGMLLDLIAGRPVPTDPVHLSSQLIVRGSTGPVTTRSTASALTG
jgi:DNA-binding LacI/PurR family transcriptional regulator